MKILVIGGSYFLGRVFVMQASKEHNLTLVNRGTYSMDAFGVNQLKADRKDETFWRGLCDDYDVIVDFCAYEHGDISKVIENIGCNIKQYIFISTVDVYERGIKGYKDEQTPLEYRSIAGEAGTYISGKVSLEQELVEQCAKKSISYTVLRPAILYGPYNYAPREAAYIQLLVQGKMLPKIIDADGQFQLVYVKDAANAIIKCLLNEASYGQAYNLCQDGVTTYSSFFDLLKQVADVEYTELPMTIETAVNQQIPLPFPLTDAETELYSNIKSKSQLGIVYTDLSEGMEKTYRAFKGVFLTE